MLSQRDDHEGEVPRMLRIIFGPSTLSENGLAKNLLQFIRLDQETHLAFKTFVGGIHDSDKCDPNPWASAES